MATNRKHLRKPLSERFWRKVTRSTSCWLWTGHINQNGYGSFKDAVLKKAWAAHRLAYELAKKPVPQGMWVDHLCRNRACVRPSHLEAVSPRENIRRGNNHVSGHMTKTHCKHGHEFTPENTYRRKDGKGQRQCRACGRISSKKYASSH